MRLGLAACYILAVAASGCTAAPDAPTVTITQTETVTQNGPTVTQTVTNTITQTITSTVVRSAPDGNGTSADGGAPPPPPPPPPPSPPSPTDTCVQPGAVCLTATDDASVKEQYPDNNYGASTVVAATAFMHDEERGLVRFVLPDLSGVSLGSACLALHSQSMSEDVPYTVHAYAYSADWDEASVTWANQPGILGPLQDTTIVQSLEVESWDVLAYVATTGAGPVAFAVQHDVGSTGTGWAFWSKEGNEAPRLLLNHPQCDA